MTHSGDYSAQLDRWIDEADGNPTVRATEARSLLAGDGAGRPVLFGAGALGRIVAQGLRKSGIEPLCFVDNGPRRWGSSVEGLAVMSLAEATERFGRNVPIVVTVYTGADLEAKLRAADFSVITFPQVALAFPDTLLPWNALELPSRMVQHRARIQEALSLWEDDRSREEYVAQVKFRATFAGPMPPPMPAGSTYFPDDLVSLEPDECFVDCGAFDGDTIDAFLRRSGGWFAGVVAIEADPVNAGRLRRYIAGLPPSASGRIRVVEAAVGATNGTVRFGTTGTVASNLVDGRGAVIEVPCRMLDDILQDCKPSYVKMDLEGAEPEALAGAREVVRQHAPVMALSLYHRQSDLWEIPLQVRAMTNRYKLFLRRHSDDCWEQVLYAIPRERVRCRTDSRRLST